VTSDKVKYVGERYSPRPNLTRRKMLRHNMNNKQLVDEIWEQAYEIFADMADLNDEELVECRLAIKGRAKDIMRMANYANYGENV